MAWPPCSPGPRREVRVSRDSPAEPLRPERLREASDDLRVRLDRLPGNHPSSPRYRDPGARSGRDGGPPRSLSGAEDRPDAGDATRRNLATRMLHEVPSQAIDRERPAARDMILNISRADMDPRKLAEYSMNPGHPQNNGKARAWEAVGYDVTTPDRRRKDAQELRELICRHLLPDGKVAAAKETADGADYRVVNGFIGPNGRHATLVTCWRVGPGEDARPRLLTTWLAVHRDDTT